MTKYTQDYFTSLAITHKIWETKWELEQSMGYEVSHKLSDAEMAQLIHDEMGGSVSVEEIMYSEDKSAVYSEISDTSKCANGFRHRMDVSGYTIAELEAILEDFQQDAQATCIREAEEEKRNAEKFEAELQKLVAIGAGDRTTAMRWWLDSVDAQDEYDMGYVCYCNNLPYSFKTEFEAVMPRKVA